MDSGKTLRWFAFSVAALVVFVGAAVICSMVLRLSHVPLAQVSTQSTLQPTDTTSAQPAVALPQPAPEPAPDLYSRPPEQRAARSQSLRTRAGASNSVQADPTQTAPALLSPGTPRPLTPDGPVWSLGPAIPATEAESTPSAPQPRTVTVKPTPPPIPERHAVTLFPGTPINVTLGEAISTDETKRGGYFRASLASPIVKDGFIIAEAGSAVTGQVVASKGAGLLGRRPELRLTLCDIRTTDNQVVRIQTYQWDEKGRSHHAVTVPFRSAFDVLAARNPGTLLLPPNTALQFRLIAPVSITERR